MAGDVVEIDRSVARRDLQYSDGEDDDGGESLRDGLKRRGRESVGWMKESNSKNIVRG